MYGIVFRVNYMLGFKISFKKFESFELLKKKNSNIICLNIDNRRELEKLLNFWKLNKILYGYIICIF